MLEMRGVKPASTTAWLRTLETVEANSRTKFVETLGTTYTLEGGTALATVAVKLSRRPGVSACLSKLPG